MTLGRAARGSEDPAVVVPLVTQHWSMLRRNLVYTAVTRGRKLVVIMGQPKALAIAVRGARARRRWSKLGEWLGGEGTTWRPTRRQSDELRHHTG